MTTQAKVTRVGMQGGLATARAYHAQYRRALVDGNEMAKQELRGYIIACFIDGDRTPSFTECLCRLYEVAV